MNDRYAIGYYKNRDLAFFGKAAPQWTAMDRYFAGTLAETFPNRIYQHAAQTDRLTNTFDISVLPTIWDCLAEKGLEGRYDFSDVPFLALWGSKYLPISRPIAAFVADALAGDLPAVSFVDPRFVDEQNGMSGDYHPHADTASEPFLNLIYTAVTRSPAFAHAVRVINATSGAASSSRAAAGGSDSGGRRGGRQHRRAARLPDRRAAGRAVGEGRRRVACPIRSHVRAAHDRMAPGLLPLTVRDETANNLAEALDFTPARNRAPRFSVPAGPFGAPCPAATTPASASPDSPELGGLAGLAASYGWPIVDVRLLATLLGQAGAP